jgi:hypothetical protein
MWQGALRDRNDATYQAVAQAIDNEDGLSIELLYSDQAGGQRTISRFALIPYHTEGGEVEWFAAINRHWYLDRPGPRSDEQVAAAVELVLGEHQASEEAALAEAEAEQAARSEVEGEAEAAGLDGTEGGEMEVAEPVSVIPRPNCE